MNAEMLVVPHPYYVVTDQEGNFRLTNVRAGEYEIEAWHEGWKVVGQGTVYDVLTQVRVQRPVFSDPVEWTKKVTVPADGTVDVDFAISDKRPEMQRIADLGQGNSSPDGPAKPLQIPQEASSCLSVGPPDKAFARERPAREPFLDLGECSTARASGPFFNAHTSNEMFGHRHSTAAHYRRDRKSLLRSNVPKIEQRDRAGTARQTSLAWFVEGEVQGC
jgi:hypothetical protein